MQNDNTSAQSHTSQSVAFENVSTMLRPTIFNWNHSILMEYETIANLLKQMYIHPASRWRTKTRLMVHTCSVDRCCLMWCHESFLLQQSKLDHRTSEHNSLMNIWCICLLTVLVDVYTLPLQIYTLLNRSGGSLLFALYLYTQMHQSVILTITNNLR